MCGISGIFKTTGHEQINKKEIFDMMDVLEHRGPDDSGHRLREYYGLGFRRLSIIDLQSGNQPIENEDGTICVICNGEIFNHIELREELRKKGHVFRSKSDVEVLVHLYEDLGERFLDRINGQFALAIIDEKRRSIMLARDQFGVMPLFYTLVEGTLLFASEIKALLTNPLVRREVDLVGMDQFFSLPHTVSPRTMFKNIKNLAPGHLMYAEAGKPDLILKQYWDLDYPLLNEEIERHSESYYMERIEELLLQSIKFRTRADVDVGAFLSGGLDSSLIVCMMKALSQNRRKIFSVDFENEEFSERKYQKIVADQLEYEHYSVPFKVDDIAERLEKVIYHTEAPVKESYNSATMALAAKARAQGIKVILTGEGSDELFAGYPSYRFDQFRKLRNQNDLSSDEEKMLRSKVWGDPLFKYEADFLKLKEDKKAIYSQQLNGCFDDFDFTNHQLVNQSKITGRHVIHQRSYIDLKVRLMDHLVSDHSDRMLMASSVEGRFPFLDINLVNFIRTVPPDLKLNNFKEKYILKQTAKKFVPDAIINREKYIFIAPGSPFLLRKNYDWINDLLSYETIKRQGYFNADEVERLKKKYLDPDFSLKTSIDTDYMLMIIMFCLFIKTFDMPSL